MPAKKRTSLDTLITPVEASPARREPKAAPTKKAKARQDRKPADAAAGIAGDKGDVIKSSMYIPGPVYEQLRNLAFEERKKIHDYIVEGIDLVFKDRGLSPIAKLIKRNE